MIMNIYSIIKLSKGFYKYCLLAAQWLCFVLWELKLKNTNMARKINRWVISKGADTLGSRNRHMAALLRAPKAKTCREWEELEIATGPVLNRLPETYWPHCLDFYFLCVCLAWGDHYQTLTTSSADICMCPGLDQAYKICLANRFQE